MGSLKKWRHWEEPEEKKEGMDGGTQTNPSGRAPRVWKGAKVGIAFFSHVAVDQSRSRKSLSSRSQEDEQHDNPTPLWLVAWCVVQGGGVVQVKVQPKVLATRPPPAPGHRHLKSRGSWQCFTWLPSPPAMQMAGRLPLWWK